MGQKNDKLIDWLPFFLRGSEIHFNRSKNEGNSPDRVCQNFTEVYNSTSEVVCVILIG